MKPVIVIAGEKESGKDARAHGNRRHGESHPPTAEYSVWYAMHQRCRGSAKADAGRYADRGIRVCKRWSRYENFLADLGRRPSDAHTLERIDNDKGYSPSNCCWATRLEQAQNTRNVTLLTARGKTQSISAWAREVGLPVLVLWKRLNRNWPLEEALSTPKGARFGPRKADHRHRR